jgi:hypothetical protein
MPTIKARIRAGSRSIVGAIALATAVSCAMTVQPASAGQNAQGIGIDYSGPIRYILLCGNNQSGKSVMLGSQVTEPTPLSSDPDAYSHVTVWLVSPNNPIYQSRPPATSPQWWFVGDIKVVMYRTPSADAGCAPTVQDNNLAGVTVCQAPTINQTSRWRLCHFTTIGANPSPAPPPVAISLAPAKHRPNPAAVTSRPAGGCRCSPAQERLQPPVPGGIQRVNAGKHP